jgi:hypothetical protein
MLGEGAWRSFPCVAPQLLDSATRGMESRKQRPKLCCCINRRLCCGRLAVSSSTRFTPDLVAVNLELPLSSRAIIPQGLVLAYQPHDIEVLFQSKAPGAQQLVAGQRKILRCPATSCWFSSHKRASKGDHRVSTFLSMTASLPPLTGLYSGRDESSKTTFTGLDATCVWIIHLSGSMSKIKTHTKRCTDERAGLQCQQKAIISWHRRRARCLGVWLECQLTFDLNTTVLVGTMYEPCASTRFLLEHISQSSLTGPDYIKIIL